MKGILSKAINYGASLIGNPDFLIGAGLGLSFGAAVFSFVEGTKAQKDISEKKKELGRDLTKPEIVAVYGKHAVGPAITLTAGTIMAIGGTRKYSETVKMLTGSLQAAALYSNTQTERMQKLENKMHEMLGDKKATEIQNEASTDIFKKQLSMISGSDIQETGRGHEVVFKLEETGDVFWSSYSGMQEACLKFNKTYTSGSATLYDLKEAIGLSNFGTLDNIMIFNYDGDIMEFDMEPTDGDWYVDSNGKKYVYCSVRLNKAPYMQDTYRVY